MSNAPTDAALTEKLKVLRAENPNLGVAKIHSLLTAAHPDWSVSEKRVKKLLQSEGLLVTPPPPKSGSDVLSNAQRPTSSVIKSLDISQYSKKIKVVDFGRTKGKGLVAVEDIGEGEVIWKEDPFVISPDWEIYDLMNASRACSHCTTPFTSSTLSSSIPCPAVAAPNTNPCSARFCNGLCLSRSKAVHPLVCSAQNSAVVPLLSFCRRYRWVHCQIAALCISRLLLANELKRNDKQSTKLEDGWEFVSSLSEVDQRVRYEATNRTSMDPGNENWRIAHQLTVEAFLRPPNPQHKKRLAKLLKVPLPDYVEKGLFEYDSFILLLVRMSLNLESHGGLYIMESHLNHSCEPNVVPRRVAAKTSLSRLTAIASRNILEGDELVIAYVDVGLPLADRRKELLPWVFGICKCTRCLREEKEEGEKRKQNGKMGLNGHDEKGPSDASEVHPGLVDELKAGFGLQ